MQAIKINTTVNLTSGLSIPSGSIVTMAEGYADIKSTKDGFIPSQIATFLYASEEAMAAGKSPITGPSVEKPLVIWHGEERDKHDAAIKQWNHDKAKAEEAEKRRRNGEDVGGSDEIGRAHV